MTHCKLPTILAASAALLALSMTSCDAMLDPSTSVGVSVGGGSIYPAYYSSYPYYALGSPFAPAPPPPAGPVFWGPGPSAPGTNGPVNRPSGRPVNTPVTLPGNTPVSSGRLPAVTQPIVPSQPIGGSSEPGIAMPPAGSGLTGTPTRSGGRM